jgi:hypothetical protein
LQLFQPKARISHCQGTRRIGYLQQATLVLRTKLKMSRPTPVAALTTVWTPPCGIDALFFGNPPTTCLPTSWSSYWVSFNSGLGYYSPAICPSGFSRGCPRFNIGQGPEPIAGEEAWNCVVQYDQLFSACTLLCKC